MRSSRSVPRGGAGASGEGVLFTPGQLGVSRNANPEPFCRPVSNAKPG
jgi:hypothetical protein